MSRRIKVLLVFSSVMFPPEVIVTGDQRKHTLTKNIILDFSGFGTLLETFWIM